MPASLTPMFNKVTCLRPYIYTWYQIKLSLGELCALAGSSSCVPLKRMIGFIFFLSCLHWNNKDFMISGNIFEKTSQTRSSARGVVSQTVMFPDGLWWKNKTKTSLIGLFLEKEAHFFDAILCVQGARNQQTPAATVNQPLNQPSKPETYVVSPCDCCFWKFQFPPSLLPAQQVFGLFSDCSWRNVSLWNRVPDLSSLCRQMFSLKQEVPRLSINVSLCVYLSNSFRIFFKHSSPPNTTLDVTHKQ